MLKSVRTTGLWALVIFFVGAWIFIGCGGGGGGGVAFKPLAQQGQITGTVTASGTLASIKAPAAAILAATGQGVQGARVYLESDWDNYNTLTATGGLFDLGVAYGTHRVIGVYTNAAGTYKSRSGSVTISDTVTAASVDELTIALANRKIRGILYDKDGNPVPNAVMYLWGERFQTDTNGEYETPSMPADSHGDIIVKTSGYQETKIPATFSSTIPPYMVTTIPTNADTNRAPIVSLKAASYEQVAPGRSVNLTGIVSDPDNDLYTYGWQVYGGTLATSSNTPTAVWTAPSGSGIATVSFSATDSRGLGGTTYVGFQYGMSGTSSSNFPPFVNIVATGTGYGSGFWYNDQGFVDQNSPALFIASGVQLTLFANSTDENNDPLTYYWFASTGTFDDSRQKQVVYTPPAIATWAFLEVYVYDPQGAGASTSTIVGINKNIPQVRIDSPKNNTIYSSGWVLFEGQASDTTGRLIYPGTDYQISWLLSGSLAASDTTNKWVQVLKPATYTLAFQVTNSIGITGSTSVSFYVNATPAVTITNPVNGSSFGSGAKINFRGSAVDTESGTIPDAGLVWKYQSQELGKGASITYSGFTASGAYAVNLLATDSNNDYGIATVVVNIGANSGPSVSISSPTSNSVFQLNQSVALVGSATDPEDGALSGANLTWYDYPASTAATSTIGNGTNLTNSFGTNGTHTITLSAKDSQNYFATAAVSIFINTAPTASITAPASGTVYSPGDSITFTGQASDSEELSGAPGAITDTSRLGWFRGDWGTGTYLGSGTTYTTTTTPNGAHTITFGGIDRHGVLATAAIGIAIGSRPTISFTPASDTVIQLGVATAFTGTATDNDPGGSMNTTTYNWYDNGTLIAGSTGQSAISYTGTSVGAHMIAFSGASAAGVYATETKRIFVNAIPEVTISSPTADFRFNTSAAFNLVFTASDSAETTNGSLTYSVYDQPGSVGALTLLSSGNTLHQNQVTYAVPTTLTNATHSLYVEVHDSLYTAGTAANTAATASVVILVNHLPTSTISITTAAFATTASSPNKIYCAQNGNVSIDFTATRADTDGGTPNVAWSTGNLDTWIENGNLTPTLNFTSVGIATIGVRVWDAYSQTQQATQVRIIDNREYVPLGFPGGVAMSGKGTNLYYAVSSAATYLYRSSDLVFTNVASSGDFVGVTFSGMSVSGDSVFYTNMTAPGALTTSWDPGWGAASPFISNFDLTLVNPQRLSHSGTSLFIAETGGDAVRKYTLGTANPYTPTLAFSVTGLNDPEGVFYDSANDRVYVADTNSTDFVGTTGAVKVYNGNLNGITSYRATGTVDLTVLESKVFSLDATNNRIWMMDAANGNLITTFRKFGDVAFAAPQCVYLVKSTNYYLYVLETNQVQRFDFGTTLW
jgi:hypothetical protein